LIEKQKLGKDLIKLGLSEAIGEDSLFKDGDWVESKDQDPEGDVRLIQLADIGDGSFRNRSNRYLTNKKAIELGCTFLEKGDVLIARMPDPLGRACLFPGDSKKCVTVVDVCIIRTKKVEHKWLMYAINSPQFRADVESLQSGSTRKRISRKNLAKIELPIPPENKQLLLINKIEELFSQLDAGVAGLKRAQAGLKRYRASVLKSAFEGRLVPQDPNDEPAEALLQRYNLEKLANNQQLPDGWVWSNLGDLSEVIQYGYTQSSSNEEVGPKFLRITDIQDRNVNWEKVPYCEINEDDFEKYQLFSGDIVFARTGATTGKSYLIDKSPNSVFASYLIRIRLKDIVNPEYCYLYFQSPMYWSQIMVTKKGSTQPGVNASILSKMNVPLPPLKEQKRLIDETKKFLSNFETLEKSINKQMSLSENLRVSILDSAFNGNFISQKRKHNLLKD
jgi:type I restriction enzyme, S subunit